MTEETQPVEEPTEAPEVPGVYVVGENGPEELVVPLDSAPLEVSRLTSWTVSPEVVAAFAATMSVNPGPSRLQLASAELATDWQALGLGQSDETTKE